MEKVEAALIPWARRIWHLGVVPVMHESTNSRSVSAGEHACRVLLVSPEPNVARTLERILARCGYAVTVADCGEGAFGCATAEPFNLVVTQVDLPGSVCGITLLHRLRERGIDVPVVILTEQDTNRLRRYLTCSPAATCLSKDVDLDLLKSTVAGCLARAIR